MYPSDYVSITNQVTPTYAVSVSYTMNLVFKG